MLGGPGAGWPVCGIDGALAVAASGTPDHVALRRPFGGTAEAVAVPLDVADATVGRGLDQRIPRQPRKCGCPG